MGDLGLTTGDWREWYDLGSRLGLAPGVHAPSAFSAFLSSTLGDCAGRIVVDAGSGAGLITVAALAAGAEHVIAIDNDPAAVRVTAANVADLLGRAATGRLTAIELDFADLGEVSADLLAVNPPQRPSRILDAVEPDQRHLHEGGGHDGLETIRLVLQNADAAVVRTTAAGPLAITEAAVGLERWAAPVLVAREEVPMHRAWSDLGSDDLRVGVWDFAAP